MQETTDKIQKALQNFKEKKETNQKCNKVAPNEPINCSLTLGVQLLS